MRAILVSVAVLSMIATSADARSRHRTKHHAPPRDSRVVALLERVLSENRAMRAELDAIGKKLNPTAAAIVPSEDLPAPRNPIAALPPIAIPDVLPTIAGYADHIAKSAKLKDLVPQLAAKVGHILSACDGARLVSGYRRNARVRGSGRPSLHSKFPSKAADLAGNPACILKNLADWPGGRSTDYGRVRHYHISYAPGSREWGSRFAHYSPRRRHASRHARHHRRYAAVH